jgi:hypothetical protein
VGMNIDEIRAHLSYLDREFPDRGDFNEAVGWDFPEMGGGLFRTVYDAGPYVVKLLNTVGEFERHNMFHDRRELHRANTQELKAWKQIERKYPSLLPFLLEPHLWKGMFNDAIIMEKVDVLKYASSGGLEKIKPLWSERMKKQYKFIEQHFADTHVGNIGWSIERDRVWLIDFNMHWDDYTTECLEEAKLVA